MEKLVRANDKLEKYRTADSKDATLKLIQQDKNQLQQ